MTSSWLVLFAALATVIPAALSASLLLFGRAVGTPLSGYLGVAGAFASLASSLVALVGWLGGGSSWGYGDRPLVAASPWLDAPPVHLAVGVQVDSLGVAWSFTATVLGVIVSVFLSAASRRDSRSHRQVAATGLVVAGATLAAFSASLLLLLASIGLLFVAGWLAGSHDAGNRIVARRAAGIAVAGATCVGLLLVASAICVHHLGGTSFRLLNTQPEMPGRGVVSVLVVLGVGVAMGLFPFQPWPVRLAFAPTGPGTLAAILTPLTAVLVLLRLDNLLGLEARQLLMVLSAFTLLLQSSALLLQQELPRTFLLAVNVGFALVGWLLARGDVSVASRLAPAMAIALAAVGVGLGTIVHVTRGQQAISRLGGLIVKLPITGTATAVGMLAVSGAMFGGVGEAFRWRSGAAGWTGWIPAIITSLLALGLARAWLLAFFGEPRHLRTHARAAEHPTLWGATVAAATFAVLCGFAWFPLQFLVEQSPVELARLTSVEATTLTTRPTTATAAMPPSADVPWGWAVGVAMAVLGWWIGERVASPRRTTGGSSWVATVVREGFFFDDFYRGLVGGVGTLLAEAMARIDTVSRRWTIVAVSETTGRLSRGIALLDESASRGQAAWGKRRRWLAAASIVAVAGGLVGAMIILLR